MSGRGRLLLPFFAVMGVLFVLPLALVVVYSFLKAGPYGGVVWEFSGESYARIFLDRDFDGTWAFSGDYLVVILRSLRLAALCTALCFLLGFPTACFMSLLPPRRRLLWMMLVTLPFWTNLLVRTYAWVLVLRDEGIVNGALTAAGIVSAPLPLLYNEGAVAAGLVCTYLPFMILPIYATLERLDRRYIEAAADLYAGCWRVLRFVVIPQVMPGIVAGCVLVFIPAIGSFITADLLGGGKKMMIGNLIQLQFGFSRDWPFGAAASVVLMAAVAGAAMLLARRGRVHVDTVL